MDRIKGKDISGLSGWLLVMAALAALSANVTALALALPLALTHMMVRFGVPGGVAGIAALGAAAIFSPATACAFAVAFIPLSIVTARSIRQKRRFRDSVLIASAAALAGVALCAGLLWLFKGLTPTEYTVQRMSGLFALLDDSSVNTVYQSVRYPDIATGAITQQAVLAAPRAEAIRILLDILRESVNYLLVPAMAIYALLWGLLCYLIPRRSARVRQMPVQSIPDFSDYALPRGLWAAFLISYLAALAGDGLGLTPSGMLGPTVMAVYAFVFIVQALSFTDFLYKARGMGTGMRVAIHAVSVLIFGSYLMWVGIFENIIRFRSRSQEKGGEEF